MSEPRGEGIEKGLEVVEGNVPAPADGEVEILSIEGGEEEPALVEAELLAAPAAARSAPPSARPAPATDRLAEELAAARERHLRLLADFENFRKRIDRERDDVRRHALFDLVRDLLPVADNLERALAAQGSAEDLRRGVEMTLRQLHEGLRKLGVAEVAALGESFDPRLHEAVAHRHDEALDGPRVVAELQRGYRLHERLLRPALVVVAAPPEGTAGEPASAPAAAAGQAAAAEDAPRPAESPAVGE